MTTSEQILAIARGQIGTVEDARGNQKFGAWYGMNGVAWCAIFTQWCFAQAGASGLIPRTAYTPTYYQWFVDHCQAGKTPRKGALVFYDWPDSTRRIQHVGLVEAVNADGSITTIEGNTTSGAAGDQSHGGGVWRRRRSTSAVVGYGYPAYTDASAAVITAAGTDTAAASPRKDDPMAPIAITPAPDGRFRSAVMVETDTGMVVSQACITYGSTWGPTEFLVTALDAAGKVLGQSKRETIPNNGSRAFPVPKGSTLATVEGKTAGSVPAAALVSKAK